MVADEAGLQLAGQLDAPATGAIASKQEAIAEKGNENSFVALNYFYFYCKCVLMIL